MRDGIDQGIIEDYVSQLVNLAKEHARKQLRIEPAVDDYVRALMDHAASAYAFNVMLSEKVQSLATELEALRRAVSNDYPGRKDGHLVSVN